MNDLREAGDRFAKDGGEILHHGHTPEAWYSPRDGLTRFVCGCGCDAEREPTAFEMWVWRQGWLASLERGGA